ncbi:MAG: GntR family transcriptional regulator [Betaproteobacteria bacterium]|nr:MAG: GntR family transcriptional regulator [Betaproteobacteria bacterium]
MKSAASRAASKPRKSAPSSSGPAPKPAAARKSTVVAPGGRRRLREPFADRAYRELRTRILDNRLRSGEQFTEEGLAAALKMSRTPTREAMLRLAAEGLVEVRPRHGMTVKPVSTEDMREIYEVLTALESTAAALAAVRSDQGDSIAQLRAAIKDMDSALERDDLSAWAQADERFHKLLVAAAGNARLTELVQTFVGQSQRVRMLTLRLRPKPTMSNRDHESVVDALEAHDAARARMLHYAHREKSGRMLVELLASHGLTHL